MTSMLPTDPSGRRHFPFSLNSAGASLTILLTTRTAFAADSGALEQNGTDAPAQLPAVSVEGARSAGRWRRRRGIPNRHGGLRPLGKPAPEGHPLFGQRRIVGHGRESAGDIDLRRIECYSAVRAQLGSNLSSNYFTIRGFTTSPFTPPPAPPSMGCAKRRCLNRLRTRNA